MLREYDIKSDSQGRQVTFSVRFITKSGHSVFLPRAVASGLPWNCKENRQRGVLAVDTQGNKIGHVYPVSIDNFVMWNNKRVSL